MKIFMHCGNFATLKEAKKHKDKCIEETKLGTVLVRKRTTSVDRSKFPYEVVLEYFGHINK